MSPDSFVELEGLVLTRSTNGRTRRRWQILYQQLQREHEPCFQTDKRYGCAELDCPWRAECGAMRAEWRR